MYFKQETYKYSSGNNPLVMPAEAPSGWYEIRVSANLVIMGGMTGMYFLGVVESATDSSDIKYVSDYAPWYAPLAQGRGVYVGSPEGPDLYLYATNTSQANIGQDVGFIGYVKHIQGMTETVALLPNTTNPPAVPDIVFGSYVIKQVTQ